MNYASSILTNPPKEGHDPDDISAQALSNFEAVITQERSYEVNRFLAADFLGEWPAIIHQQWALFLERKNPVLDILYGDRNDAQLKDRSRPRGAHGFTDVQLADFKYLYRHYGGGDLSNEEAGQICADLVKLVEWLYEL